MAEKTSQTSSASNMPNVPAVAPTSDTPYIQPLIGKLGFDTEHPDIFGIGSSPDNGVSFHVWASFKGLVLDKDDMEAIWIHGVSNRVKSEVNSATAEIPAVKSAADEAVKKAESAIASSKVNSDALVAQSNAISEAKSSMESSVAEINQAIADASSNAAKIRADVDQVQNEVNSAKSANESTVAQIKSDISQTNDSLTAVNDKLTQAQSAANQAQSALREQVNQLSASVTANQSAITQAQTANDNVAKRLDVYASQASAQGETIKSVQSDVAGNASTIADINSNVNQVQQTADNLSASLKNADSSIASVKAQADNLSVTLSNQAKSIASVTATATQIKASLSDATGRLSTLEQTSSSQSATLSDVQKNLNNVTATATTLTNTLSDAQGSITKLQASTKSTQEQISDLQGNYTALQTTVNGLSTTVSNHDKSIESLQVTANGLTNSVKDAQGNISSLQATAKTLNSSMTDAQGRLSRVEQTATANSSTISSVSNKVDNIKIGGTNLLKNTGQDIVVESKTTDRYPQWDNKCVSDALINGETYTISAEATNTNDVQQASIRVYIDVENGKYVNKEAAHWYFEADGKRHSFTFTIPNDGTGYKIFVYAGPMGTKQGKEFKTTYHHLKLERGNKSTDWSPAPEDVASSINQVKQTADANTATISDAKGDINSLKQTATSLQATLTNHGNDIASLKTTATDLTSKYSGLTTIVNGKANQSALDSLNTKVTANSTAINQNKSAIALKANQSTVDNLNNTLSNVKSQLTVQANEISSKVSSTDFKDLNKKVDSNTTAINQNKSAIALKADQTVVDAVKNTASQNSSRLNVMAGEISSKVTSTDVNNIVDKRGYATTSTVQSLITQKAGTINENITNLTSKVNSNGGGVNLLPNSKDLHTGWTADGTSIYPVDDYLGVRATSRNQRLFINPTEDTKGKLLSVSFDACVPSDSKEQDVQIWVGPFQAAIGIVVSGSDFKRYKAEDWKWNSYNSAFSIQLKNVNDKINIKNIKLEFGPVATPYSPAPSDEATVTQVQSLTASIDGLQSIVQNKADMSKVTQLSNLVQSKVSSSDFNNLKNKIEWTENDNIDFNNCKTQMNVFTHSSTNAPNSNYWWYLQVMPGQDGKVMQYATSDRDDKHYTRQFTSSWTAWREDASESEITQLRDQINLRVTKGDLLSQINLEAGRALFQSKKIFMDADTVVMGPNTKAFIPSAAITNVDADIINTGILNGIEIRQVPTNGRSIDIKDGNIAISSNDPYEPRISFTNNGKDAKMFNAVGDIEVINQEFALFNFTPEDTHSLNPIQFFKVTNTGQIGSGGAQLNMDHAIFDGYEWWTPSAGVTFGRTWNGVDKSSDYADIYAKSFVPHSELSAKTRIKKLDRKEALDKIMQDDMYTYQFKEDVRDGVSKRYASFIIDNVHDVAQYAEPEEFLSANGKGRDDGTQLAYLIAAVQYQQEQIEELKKKLEEK